MYRREIAAIAAIIDNKCLAYVKCAWYIYNCTTARKIRRPDALDCY
jgi:hypothetical protein